MLMRQIIVKKDSLARIVHKTIHASGMIALSEGELGTMSINNLRGITS